ncbi:MAG: THUMP domain-containing protein [Bacteroidales bacterium]|jgi:putative N6-adenine-specific DNA methylase|nr:THUMP domain-containing protein [Bacteroidales bacterium]
MNQFHAKTYKGLENLLAEELVEIGASDVVVVNRGVDFKGSIAMMYKANLYLRTALRVLMPIAKFKALDEEILYKKIKAIDWSEYMTYKNSFVIDAVTFSSVFRNNHYVEQKVKDAIVDQFREKTSLRPSVNVKNAEIRINIHINQTFFTVSLDSSGDSLHKRGYRKEMHAASLSEVLAAGMVLLTGWKGETPLINPMCGSGTIAIEAAMIAANIYPGITGRGYSFQYWPDFDELLFGRLLEGMPEPLELKYPILASDIDGEAIRITKANVRGIGLDKEIEIKQMDFTKSEEVLEGATIIMNPPYGERLEVENIDELYSGIGSSLKHKYPGSKAWIFSANMGALKFIGLKPDKKLTLFNSGLECRYQKYSLFSGTRKSFITTSM